MAKSKSSPSPQTNVRQLRRQLGLTQKELAAKAAVSLHSIRGTENGSRQLSPELRVRIVVAISEHSASRTGTRLSFRDVFPSVIPEPRLMMEPPAGSPGQYFVLEAGPFGNPPELTIRGFSSSPEGACGLPPFNTAAFDFVPTDQSCSGSPICVSK